MSENVKRYHDLVAALNSIYQFGGSDIEEDNYMDELDALWGSMTKEERQEVDPEYKP